MKITREYLLKIGGWAALKEADGLYRAGKVQSAQLELPLLWGQVQTANGLVSARLHVSERLFEVENLCSCRQARSAGTICPHVLAVGLKLIDPVAPVSCVASALGSPLTTEPPKTAAGPASSDRTSRFIPASDTAEDGSWQIQFLLPLDLAGAWRTGQLRVIVEASANGLPGRLLESALKNLSGVMPINEEAVAPLQFLEQKLSPKEPIPSMWMLDKKEFEGFLTRLIGNPNVSLGKRSGLKVQEFLESPVIQMETSATGEIQLSLLALTDSLGQWLPSPTGRWLFDRIRLRFQPVVSPTLAQLASGPVTLAREQVPRFISEELPVLKSQVEVRQCARSLRLRIDPELPTIRATLDGTSSGLSCRLDAIYATQQVVLTGNTSLPKSEWSPDPSDPLHYLIRSGEIERAALQQLSEAGFVPGSRNPEFHQLSGEKSVLNFLANHYPDWKANPRWELLLQPRLMAFLNQCEWINPEISIRDLESRQGSGQDWLAVELSYRSTSGGAELSAGEVQQLLQTGRTSQRLASGRLALLPTQKVTEWQETLLDCDENAGIGTLQIKKEFAPYLLSTFESKKTAWTPPKSLLTPPHLTLDPSLSTILRPYQLAGVEWMAYLAHNKFGGVLADEMGLGKTLQTLAYLHYRRSISQPTAPALIICPTSLLANWQNESHRFTPSLKTLIFHGADRHQALDSMAEVDLVITSYALIRRDREIYQKRAFDAVVLDEAQAIKNRFSQSAQSVKGLQSQIRLILTGTPMENSLLDLWSIFDFLMPGYLGTAQSFRERYELPITKRSDLQAQRRLKKRLQPFILRRTKKEVAPELPAKIETVLFTELSDDQKSLYRQILDQGRREIFDLSGKADQGKRTIMMLTTLTRLRQVSCHLGMLPGTDSSRWKEPSAKLELLMETITEAIEGGHRLLIFSQFVRLLKFIAQRLEIEALSYCYLDGATKDRAGEVARFQKSSAIPIFLISLKAGGTGLNLTGADTVIHCDPWWNPAVEEQATARAHRIGQNQIVTSYKLIAKGTVEEKILELQAQKRALIAQTMGDEGEAMGETGLLSSLTPDEWSELLTY